MRWGGFFWRRSERGHTWMGDQRGWFGLGFVHVLGDLIGWVGQAMCAVGPRPSCSLASPPQAGEKAICMPRTTYQREREREWQMCALVVGYRASTSKWQHGLLEITFFLLCCCLLIQKACLILILVVLRTNIYEFSCKANICSSDEECTYNLCSYQVN